MRRPASAAGAVGGAMIGVVTGRRSKWAVVAIGVVVVALVGPLAGKLGPLEDNSPSSFLPAGAQSSRVVHDQLAHRGAASSPAIVVYQRHGGLRGGDRQTIRSARAAIASARLPRASRPTRVTVARNGRAATFSVPISSAASQTTINDDVGAIRGLVARGATPATGSPRAGALEVAVGGPAAAGADAADAFSGINGRLLVVTVAIVAVLLLSIYRSPFLWLVPLVSVLLAAGWAQGFAYALARGGAIINGMTVGILTVLVFGAGTDYALLLVARYREELRRHEDHHEAMAVALRRAGPAILTSGLTVILSLLCLLVAQLGDVAALGPACATAIFCALVAQLLFLPALLVVVGRRAFWPFVPHGGDEAPEQPGLWGRFSRWLLRHPRPTWVSLAALLGACCLGLLAYQGGVNQQNGFRNEVGSVQAQKLLAENFPAGDSAPATVLVLHPDDTARARAAARGTPGVTAVSSPMQLGQARVFTATLSAGPTTSAAQRTIIALRHRLGAAVGSGALVGGETATNVDLAAAATHDRTVIIPIVLAVVLVMLGLLLRAIVAPLMLVATVLLSYVASLGITSLVVRHIFGFPGFDQSVPIFGFVFLVALGVDYNIFLMARVREEARHGARRGVATGLAVTGAVITSAGIVLAATFAVLAVLPLIALTEIGFLVALGVLIDTILIRSALVPALAIDIGPRLWWPSALVAASREPAVPGRPPTRA